LKSSSRILFFCLCLGGWFSFSSVTVHANESHDELRKQVARLISDLASPGSGWSEEAIAKLKQTFNNTTNSSVEAKLNEFVFATIIINPEGRVKLTRGDWPAILLQNQSTSFLIRIENHSGGQHRLKPLMKYVGEATNPFQCKWKQVDRFGADLLGLPVEYRLLELRCTEAGLRELTLIMEAGQGTQDLGFRSEIPALFRVNPKSGTK
jgi:hypothetical protein